MLKAWKLSNFKSVAKADLRLAPLTLFAGANSSGKSTLLQSILLISQTLASRVLTQRVLLNGYLTKLGQMNDLTPAWASQGNVRIGWELAVSQEKQESPPGYVRTSAEIESISGELIFGVSPAANDKSSQLNPIVFECQISCIAKPLEKKSAQRSFIKIKRRPNTPESDDSTDPDKARFQGLSFDFEISLDDEAMEDLRDELAGANPTGCYFQHFIPYWLIVQFNEKEEIKKTLVNSLLEPARARQAARDLSLSEYIVPEEIIAVFKEHSPEVVGPLISRSIQKHQKVHITLVELINQIREIPFRKLREISQRQEFITQLAATADRVLTEKRRYTSTGIPGGVLGNAIDQTSSLLTRNIRYLGPLREEPRSLYPLQSTADPQDVGLHGEHTAAVFHNFQSTEVRYIPSSSFGEQGSSHETINASLKDAVFDWLKYLDIASRVGTTDRGKFGHDLSVFLEGSTAPHDLTHVGVGVSQILPIVVMCLLASKGTTLMVEQPELHLNPKVQTRLADFFLSMSLLNKQCLIETHSEYLINRLRLRAALGEGASLASLMKLYFVEKIDGVSQYRDVQINEYGTIVDWPVGFFDQSQREIERILLAATDKASGTKG